MARKSGVLMRQLLDSSYKCSGLLRKPCNWELLSGLIKNEDITSPNSYNININPSTLKLPPNDSLFHLRNRVARYYTTCSAPSNLRYILIHEKYYEALKKVEDERYPALFYFNELHCCVCYNKIWPILYELCELFPHVTIYRVYMDQNGDGQTHTLDELKIYHSPTFRFYLNGEMVDELKSASTIRLRKTLANIYGSYRVRKRIATLQAKKDVNDRGVELSGPCDGAVEVAEIEFPATSYPKVMEVVESLPGATPYSYLWWFAKGLFLSHEKRELFSEIDDPAMKLNWLINARAEE